MHGCVFVDSIAFNHSWAKHGSTGSSQSSLTRTYHRNDFHRLSMMCRSWIRGLNSSTEKVFNFFENQGGMVNRIDLNTKKGAWQLPGQTLSPNVRMQTVASWLSKSYDLPSRDRRHIVRHPSQRRRLGMIRSLVHNTRAESKGDIM